MYKDPYIRNEHGTDVTHNTVAHSSVFNQDMHEKRIFEHVHACLADSIFHVTNKCCNWLLYLLSFASVSKGKSK